MNNNGFLDTYDYNSCLLSVCMNEVIRVPLSKVMSFYNNRKPILENERKISFFFQ